MVDWSVVGLIFGGWSMELSEKKNQEKRYAQIDAHIQNWYDQWVYIDRLYAEFAQRFGLTLNALFALRTLIEHPEIRTQRELGQALLMPKQTVSSLLSALEKSGDISRTENRADKRIRTVELTQTGKAKATRMREALIRAEREAFILLPARDRDNLTRINRSLMAALTQTMRT